MHIRYMLLYNENNYQNDIHAIEIWYMRLFIQNLTKLILFTKSIKNAKVLRDLNRSILYKEINRKEYKTPVEAVSSQTMQ